MPNIPPRKPANIPLHTLSNSPRHIERVPSSPSSAESQDEKPLRSRRASEESAGSAGSEFSLWSDTGDLVDQLADEEDPLRSRARQSADEDPSNHIARKRFRREKRVRYQNNDDAADDEKGHHSGGPPKRKEDIQVPSPAHKAISWGEKFIALVLAPTDSHARTHGLRGQKLVYVTTISILRLLADPA